MPDLRQWPAQPPPGVEVPVATSSGTSLLCLLCRRKFYDDEDLERHIRLSELHRRNVDRQGELVQQHKQEVLAGVAALRQQLHEAAMSPEGSSSRCAALESQLRQLLGEFGMAQEMLEHNRALREPAEFRTPTSHEARVGRLGLDIGVACWQGGKEVQEDRFILDLQLTSPEGLRVAGFCVLDGHSGSRCVEHLVERLPRHLQACLSGKPALTEEHLSQAVAEACALADSEFLVRARQLEMMDGSTMILGLLFPEAVPKPPRLVGSCKLLIANVGDSRAVLCRVVEGSAACNTGGRLGAIRLSEDHKPNRLDEQQRIKARGGIVDHHGVWRVFLPSAVFWGGRAIPRWGLAVSRSFGDLLLKEPERYGCPSVAPGGLVIAEPEIRTAEVELAGDRFLILACDGIWDVLRDEDAVAVCASQAGAELAAHSLVRHAFAAGSGDNLTALVVSWRPTD